jgi:two-component system, response regulator YesN
VNNDFSYKIIVVEDVELIAKSIVRNIQQLNMGFDIVATAENGKIALDLIEKYTPEIVLSDIKMPVMSGLELMSIINEKYPFIVKIIISGYDDFVYAQQALKFQVKDYLLKPLKEVELQNMLSKMKIYLDAQRQNTKMLALAGSDVHKYSTDQIVDMVITYLQENFSQEISMDSIASSLNFNSSYLSKIFTKRMGENPLKYLTNLRINKAKYLLARNQDLSIKEVGALVGYENQYYFSRVFKAATGVNPARYRGNS